MSARCSAPKYHHFGPKNKFVSFASEFKNNHFSLYDFRHFFFEGKGHFFPSPNSRLARPPKMVTKCPSRFADRDKRSHVMANAVGHEPNLARPAALSD
jgi:hypothetical protein